MLKYAVDVESYHESPSVRNSFLQIATMLQHPLIFSQLLFLSEFEEIYFSNEFQWNYLGAEFPFPLPVGFRSHQILSRWFDRFQFFSTFGTLERMERRFPGTII